MQRLAWREDRGGGVCVCFVSMSDEAWRATLWEVFLLPLARWGCN